MNRGAADPWSGEKMTRSDAQRRYSNLVLYQLRPMLANRTMMDENRISILKRIIQQASRFKYESNCVAGGGTREEVVDLLTPYLKVDHPWSPDLKDWVKRTIRAFGASLESSDD